MSTQTKKSGHALVTGSLAGLLTIGPMTGVLLFSVANGSFGGAQAEVRIPVPFSRPKLHAMVTRVPVNGEMHVRRGPQDTVSVAQTVSNKSHATQYAAAGQLIHGPHNSDTQPASEALKSGLRALSRGRTSEARKIRSRMPAGSLDRKILAWSHALNGSGMTAVELASIALDLADWPEQGTIKRNVERGIARETKEPQAVRAAFSEVLPETPEAAIALASAYQQLGDTRAARNAIAPIWRNETLSPALESAVLKQFGKFLSKADHRFRVDRMLAKKRIRSAERIAGLAGATRMVAAAGAVIRKQRSAGKRLATVPSSQHTDPTYAHHKARYLRRKDRITDAAQALLRSRGKVQGIAAGDAHWKERRNLAADLLDAGKPKLAYQVASRNVAGSDTKKADAAFYAGWIALRFLGDTAAAKKHFSAILDVASRPISQARGYYWLGRVEARSGNQPAAKAFYKKAARHDTTYYGQLAARKLGLKKLQIARTRPTADDRIRFPRYELVQAIRKLESAGYPARARAIYRDLAKRLNNPGEIALLAAMAERRGDHKLALNIGKLASYRGMAVDTLAFPIGVIPSGTNVKGAGLPMSYAVARQESTFQIDARSRANALGLLQLLPGTAKQTARKIGVRYSRSRLTTDPAYNARLGAAYLKQQIDRFNGSLVMTFAAYNAGPSRAVKWADRYGDPRGQSADWVVDWVERIPFSETRNYVQRVMENYQVYKARLEGRPLSITEDLSAGGSS